MTILTDVSVAKMLAKMLATLEKWDIAPTVSKDEW